MTEHAVVIAGGGPTGMMLAAELALASIDVAIVERRPDQAVAGSRAGGLHSRTLEVFDQRGVADRFVAEGQRYEAAPFANAVLDMSDLPTRFPYSLGIFQKAIERIMAGWVAELDVQTYYGREVMGFGQDETGVDVALASGGPLRAQYLVGCDGGRSLIRKGAGTAFPGWDATKSNLIAEVEMSEEPQLGLHHDAAGVHGLRVLDEENMIGVVTTEHELQTDSEPTLGDLSQALTTVFGTDFGVHSPTWISRFTDATRHAAAYRDRRVLLAGDAAHIHYPVGGQGLQLGVQDAVNLGWKLAQVVDGTSPESLLDSYQAERHPATARTLKHTLAMGVLQSRDDRMEALADLVSELAAMDQPRHHLAAIVTGLDVHYDLGEGHPLLGRRMPDLDLIGPDGAVRAFELLHGARPLLLNLGQPGDIDIAAWADRVQLVEASHAGEWALPVLGTVDAPSAVLVRPDGHVAWVGEGMDAGLTDALATWFGPPAAG